MHTQSHTTGHVRRFAAALTAGIALSSLATPSNARSYDPLSVIGADSPQIMVRFADLDVSHPRGAAILYRRISSAAKEVCSPIESRGYYSIDRREACIDEAITNAVNTVNQPALFAEMGVDRARSPTARLVSQSR
jgi:UrcA family protein